MWNSSTLQNFHFVFEDFLKEEEDMEIFPLLKKKTFMSKILLWQFSKMRECRGIFVTQINPSLND